MSLTYRWDRLTNYRPAWLPAPTSTDRDAINGRGWWTSGVWDVAIFGGLVVLVIVVVR